MFRAAIFIIGKTWKQPVSTDGRMDKETVVYKMEYDHPKQRNLTICNNINRP